METAMVEPGFAKLPLDVNAENFDAEDVANYEYKILENFLEEKIDRPERYAIRNLLGFIDARLTRYDKAIEIFNNVLEEDKDNLNALANLQWVYETMGSDKDTRQDQIAGSDNSDKQDGIAQRLDDLMRPILDTVESSHTRIIKARALTEHGYALCRGEYTSQYASALDASTMYDQALELAGDIVPIEEKTDWILGSTRAKHSVMYSKVRRKDFTGIDPYLEKQLIERFELVLEHGDKIMKAETWIKLGSMFMWFAKRAKFDGTASTDPPTCIIGKHQFLACYNEPKPALACYEKALGYRPNHPPFLTLKAKMMKHFVYTTTPDYDSALRLLDKSIEADSTLMNRYAFSMRGQIYLNMYIYIYRKRRDARQYLDTLLKANADYEVSNKMHAVSEDYRAMGDIWRYMSTDHSDEILVEAIGKNKRECLEKALEYFTLATTAKGGAINPVTQWKRGECCLVMGDYKEAGKCYELNISYATHDKDTLRVYPKLFYTYLMRIQNANQHDNEVLVDEAVVLVKKAIDKFDDRTIGNYCIQYPCRHYDNNADIVKRFQMFADICREKGEIRLASFVERYSGTTAASWRR